MRLKNAVCFSVFLLLLLSTSSRVLNVGEASENQDIDFEIIGRGDVSGYREETYLVIRDEAEWARVWAKHTGPCMPKPSHPEIAFSEKILVCAFMGERPTGGYSISIERIWVDEEKVHVGIAKNAPPRNIVVIQVLTHPYIIVLLDRVDAEVVFRVTEENGAIVDYILPEFPTMAFSLAVFVALSVFLFALKLKVIK